MWKNTAAIAACLVTLAAYGTARAQAPYPTKPIRVVTTATGGNGDFSSRVIAQGLTGSLGQQAIVENRGGASGIIGAQLVAQSPPDGYTFAVFASQFWLLPFLQDNVPYDPVKDFASIAVIDKSPTVLVAHPSLPVSSVLELIAFAKARPGKLNYSRPSSGTPTHLSAELLKSMAGINIVGIAYKSGGLATISIISGEVDLGFAGMSSAAGAIKSKRLKPLAVTSLERSFILPEVPTMDASGLPGFESVLVTGMFAPAGTPASVISVVNREVLKTLQDPNVKQRYSAAGIEAVGSSPETLASFVKSDMAKWGKLIKAVGIHAD